MLLQKHTLNLHMCIGWHTVQASTLQVVRHIFQIKCVKLFIKRFKQFSTQSYTKKMFHWVSKSSTYHIFVWTTLLWPSIRYLDVLIMFDKLTTTTFSLVLSKYISQWAWKDTTDSEKSDSYLDLYKKKTLMVARNKTTCIW